MSPVRALFLVIGVTRVICMRAADLRAADNVSITVSEVQADAQLAAGGWDDSDWFEKRKREMERQHEDFRKKFDDDWNNNHRNNDNGHNWSHNHHFEAHHAGIPIAVALLFILIWSCVCCGIVGLPCLCLCRGHFKARGLRDKLEHLKLQHPPLGQRLPVSGLDGMARLGQEDRILIKEKVNMMQELSGHIAGYSIQTANCFDVVSVTAGGEQVLSCREVQDLQAMLGMNLAGALGAMGVDTANHFAGRDKAPFRMCIGLPPILGAAETGVMQVVVPEGVLPGQQIQVTSPTGEVFQVAVPPGVLPGQTMEVHLPSKNQSPKMQQMIEGLVPGAAANNDTPFLYLDRPFALDCCCINRPKVDVFDVRSGCMVKLGIISDPFAWMDMTFGIHVGPNVTESDPPILVVRGAACQPGAACKCCGLCCGRTCQEVYLEVVDPNDGEKTVAFITKGWAGGMKEIFTSANSFYVDFGEVKDPACKALLLATALFLNFRFFEGQAGKTTHD